MHINMEIVNSTVTIFMYQIIKILNNMIKWAMKFFLGWKGALQLLMFLNNGSLVFYFGLIFFFSILLPFYFQISSKTHKDNITIFN